MKRILLKLSGELLTVTSATQQNEIILSVIKQVKDLSDRFQFGIVIGGGNFFRGAQHGKVLGLSRSTADSVGMLATVMNGLMLQDLFAQHGLPVKVVSSIVMPAVVTPSSSIAIREALQQGFHIIFAGGTGLPYVTTDTNAVIRALQIEATELWKATKVDFVYEADPVKNPQAKALPNLTYQQALDERLAVMDATALTLAQEHSLRTRVFNIFAHEALLHVAHNKQFGSTIT